MGKKGLVIGGVFAAAVLGGMSAIGGCTYWYNFGTEETVTFTVDEKERTSGSGGNMLVYTSSETNGNEVFKVTDSYLRGMFRSSDRYAALDEGETYTCDVNGKRIGFFSEYRNLLECELVSASAPVPGT